MKLGTILPDARSLRRGASHAAAMQKRERESPMAKRLMAAGWRRVDKFGKKSGAFFETEYWKGDRYCLINSRLEALCFAKRADGYFYRCHLNDDLK